jgi:DNA replication protein DnaC
MSPDVVSPTAELEQLGLHCQHLRLTRVAQLLPTLLEQAAQQELSYSAFLQVVLATEVAAKQEKHHTMRVQMARFPFTKRSTASTGKRSRRLIRK